MTSKKQLLERLVALHDRCGRPVTPEELAERLATDPGTIREGLRSLRSYELTKTRGDEKSWEPTITARELLELDIDSDEFVVIEIPDDDPDGA